VVPYLTTFQATNHLIETLEHFPLTWTRQASVEWTRNRKGPWFERWLTGAHGEGWHRVHHLLPGIPFWNLERAHEILMTDPVYAAFERESGGIFVRGRNGEPPIIKAMIGELAAYQYIHLIQIEEVRS
jgi:fatty acid desaturase